MNYIYSGGGVPLFSSNLANLIWQIWEKVICKDPTIGYDFFWY